MAAERDAVSEQAALLGVRYLLAELPLFFCAPKILGTEKAVFVYHQCPTFITLIYQDPERSFVSPGQGFGILQGRDNGNWEPPASAQQLEDLV